MWESDLEDILDNGIVWRNITTVLVTFPRPKGINYIKPAVNSLLASGEIRFIG